MLCAIVVFPDHTHILFVAWVLVAIIMLMIRKLYLNCDGCRCHGTVCWPTVCDCGSSWSYTLALRNNEICCTFVPDIKSDQV